MKRTLKFVLAGLLVAVICLVTNFNPVDAADTAWRYGGTILGNYVVRDSVRIGSTLTVQGDATLNGAVTTAGLTTATGGLTFSAPFTWTSIRTQAAATETLTVAQSGSITVTSVAGANVFCLPTPSSSTVGKVYGFMNAVDQNMSIKSTVTDGNAIIADGVATTDLVIFSTASHKLGAVAWAYGVSATKWVVGWGNGTTGTVEAAD